MAPNESIHIDIDKVVATRAKGKKFPKFLINWIKKLIHQDELNEYFDQGTLGVEFAEGAIKHLGVTFELEGIENIPAEGRFTFACNHPLGGIEALEMVAFLGRRYNEQIASPANDFLMNVKQVQQYLVPVNKLGAQARELSGQLEEIFASDKQIFFFPAGLCSRKIDGKVQDLPWKKTFITKSRQHHRDIIPMWCSGQNSKRFYRIDRLCKALKLKTNLAMFLLPDELFKTRGKTFRIVIGKPVPWETFTPEKKDIEWAAYMRDVTYSLAKE